MRKSKVPPAPKRLRKPEAERLRTYELLLSYDCNAKCGFCYNPPLTPELLSQDITLERAAALMSLARRDGYRGVWFTGGDPSLRADLPQLLLLAKRLGFERIQIGTNALRLGREAYTRRLVDAGLNFVRISLHAATAPVHDELLRLPGSFDAALQALSHLRRFGAEVGINFVVTARNYRELPAFFRLCLVELRVPHFDVIFAHHRGMMEINAGELGVRHSEVVPYLREAFRFYGSLRGSKGTPNLVNMPPCLAPELQPWVADWSSDMPADLLAHPSSESIDLQSMKGGQRMKAQSCVKCRWNDRCLGFEGEYARLYGMEEFVPVQLD